jgi:hypothetical protein
MARPSIRKARKEEASADNEELKVKLKKKQLEDMDAEIDRQVKEKINQRAIRLKRCFDGLPRKLAAQGIFINAARGQDTTTREINYALRDYTGGADEEEAQ